MPKRSDAKVVWFDILEVGFWMSIIAGISAVPMGLVLTDTTAAAFLAALGSGAFGGFLTWLGRLAQWRLTLIDSPIARRLAVQ